MQMVEEGCQALAAVAGGDAVEARVGAELFYISVFRSRSVAKWSCMTQPRL